ncbi:ROK family transcriptional regulator [Longispora sp. K20-0274]|uniref:ROK family transcriptional regulator n=1 Tax=Longispora sp. K20-0274 TaxID=3088255 RepID=UPI00399A37E0
MRNSPTIRPDGRRSATAAHVLRTVLDHGPLSRTTIARLTGLSPAAITRHYTELAAVGLLSEAPGLVRPSGVGRPHVPVDLADGPVVCGVHIAVPHVTLALADLRGRVLAQETFPHGPVPAGGGPDPAVAGPGDAATTGPTTNAPGATSPDAVLRAIRARLPRFMAGHDVVGVGLVTGGWVDPARGVIVEHPVLGWRDVPAADALGDLGVPVRVESHARALALAEQLFGASRGTSSLVHLFVGNVVDAAIVTGGAAHHGPGSAAGVVGHLPLDELRTPCACGRAGCFQAAAAEGAMLARSGERDLPTLLARAEAGDRAATGLFRERAALVGRAAALLFDLINPEVLVVTEPGILRLPDCLAVLRAEARRHSQVCVDPERTILPSSFPGRVLGMAAVTAALDAVYRRPLALDLTTR